MDIKQLDYFVHVADLGSFTKAASLLSVAQSALSHQVRQLEVELEQTLLYRNGRGVTRLPTSAPPYRSRTDRHQQPKHPKHPNNCHDLATLVDVVTATPDNRDLCLRRNR